jgi:hypothetical protein
MTEHVGRSGVVRQLGSNLGLMLRTIAVWWLSVAVIWFLLSLVGWQQSAGDYGLVFLSGVLIAAAYAWWRW